MLWPDRWPPTFGSGPACCSASPRVPPGGMTTASLSCASAEEVAAVQRQLHDLAVLDDVADLGGGGLQQRRGRGDRDLLGQALHAERELERQRPADLEDDPAARLRRKPGSGAIRSHCRCAAPAGRSGRRHRSPARRRCRWPDASRSRSPRQHAAAGVADDAADLAGVDLGRKPATRAHTSTAISSARAKRCAIWRRRYHRRPRRATATPMLSFPAQAPVEIS